MHLGAYKMYQSLVFNEDKAFLFYKNMTHVLELADCKRVGFNLTDVTAT